MCLNTPLQLLHGYLQLVGSIATLKRGQPGGKVVGGLEIEQGLDAG